MRKLSKYNFYPFHLFTMISFKRIILVIHIILLINNNLNATEDSLNLSKKTLKKLQHSFDIGLINSNFNWFKWSPYYYGSYNGRKVFKSDVITDIDFSYSLNYKSVEMTLLNKFIPNSYPFGTKDIVFVLLGYGRRYHHDFTWGIQAGWATRFYYVSTPITDNCPDVLPTGIPCYPQYEYSRPASIIQLYFGYKFFKNKNLHLGIKIQSWMEYYNWGKTNYGDDWLILGIFMKYSIYQKK